jgi:hypothetical protein
MSERWEEFRIGLGYWLLSKALDVFPPPYDAQLAFHLDQWIGAWAPLMKQRDRKLGRSQDHELPEAWRKEAEAEAAWRKAEAEAEAVRLKALEAEAEAWRKVAAWWKATEERKTADARKAHTEPSK